MKIVIIHQYYKTPQQGGAIRSYYIAEHLAALGHEVDVITAYNEKEYQIKQNGRVTVHYLPVYYTNHLSFLSRIHAFYRFVRKSIKLLKKMQPVDLNYVITTPLTTGLIALFAKRRFGTPYFFEVGDLWPDAPVSLGVLKNALLKKLAYKLEKTSYENACQLIALSPDIKNAIEQKLPGSDVEVITNFADTQFFSLAPKREDLLKKYNVGGKFVVAYTGTVGMANQLEYLLDVASLAQKHEKNIHFIVAGSGARWTAIRKQALARRLDNITFIDFLNKEGVKEVLNVSDALFISFRNTPVLATGSPNKFFDGLAAGKLIIINFRGWIGRLLAKYSCGFSYLPESPLTFLDQVEPYIHDRQLLQEAKVQARQVAEQFTPEVQLKKLTRLIANFEQTYLS
ncbi:glycosyltransferase family 4 protein [Fulvivirga sp. 29W222]|uniref:Glycosyltransferase family 4 protein n=1 Tax=Fulvivirga marina TaxID=2494733 RepID=A0A937KER8_9BACT|nr:glycosyltransferase family 4 protein [Fulvivirga marina]MBL6447470.1 glycosyltransferase family 4 protein [Fulvivirga marina]